jgi:aerotolerance regulator-like protein/VWA domain-containing protein
VIFTAPWGLLTLLAIPAIIIIHLFRRRFPPRRVAGLFLWRSVRVVPESGGKRTKLPVTRSLILECLGALALALIIAGARMRPDAINEHLVILLDDSISMTASNARGESARDRAVKRALTEMSKLRANSRVSLIESGERPGLLLGPAALAIEAPEALKKWSPQAPHHSYALGLRLARELAGSTGRVMVLSDAPPELPGRQEVEGVLWVAVGEPMPNVAITAAQRTVSPEQGTAAVSLTLENFSDTTAHRTLRIMAGSTEALSREIDVPSGPVSLNLPLTTGLPAVQVQLSHDALKLDDEAILVEPHSRIVGIENRLPDGRGHEALAKAISVLSGVTQAQNADLVFEAAGEIHKSGSSSQWHVGFGRPSSEILAPGEPKDFVGPFIPEKRHALLDGITLAGVVWAGASPLAVGKVHPLVSAGDQPLIAVLGDNAEKHFFFNLDLNRTNLIRAPDWPILISNLVEMRRKELQGPERWNYRVGEWIRIQLEREPKGKLHFRCAGLDRDLPSSRSLEFVAPAPGGLLQVMEGDRTLFELGVNLLDRQEGDLRGAVTRDVGAFNAQAAGLRTETGAALDPLFWFLLIIGAAAILANWCFPESRRHA